MVTGDRHRIDEVFLEAWLDSGLDLLDVTDLLFDRCPRVSVEQRNTSTGARCIAGRRNFFEIALGNQAEHHREFHINVGTKGAGQSNTVNLLYTEVLHQEFRARMQCSFGQLNCAYVVLQNTNSRIAIVQNVGLGPAILDDSLGLRWLDLSVGADDAGREHLRNDFNNAGAADTGYLLHFFRKLRIIRPELTADDAEPWLKCLAIDPDSFDCARGRALT